MCWEISMCRLCVHYYFFRWHASVITLCSQSCVHLCVFTCACVLECEPCVNMLIQAVPVTHSCPAWLRSGKLIILACSADVSQSCCVWTAERRYHSSTLFVIHYIIRARGTDECVCCDVLVSSEASPFSALQSQQQSGVSGRMATIQAALHLVSQLCGQYVNGLVQSNHRLYNRYSICDITHWFVDCCFKVLNLHFSIAILDFLEPEAI